MCIISRKSANFETKIFESSVFFSDLVNYFCESCDFYREACGSTGQQRCQIGHFMANFEKFGDFFCCAGHEKTYLAILYNLAFFSVCYCKIEFSLNIMSFCIFGRYSCHSLLQ